jgi:RNA polymerase sigma factor (sigma-70 family)
MVSTGASNLFVSIIESHKGILFKIANAYCRDPENRNDLIQETILQLWKSFENYDNQYKYSTWIYRIALNVAISFYRSEKRRNHLQMPICEVITDLADTSNKGETEDKLLSLHLFISELKEIDKAMMLLYLDEKSHKEIAEIIGISETNVATKIGRVKIILKHKFLTR